ncbi:MAG: Ig-like domain-containing protein [Chloroflexota bacterium]
MRQAATALLAALIFVAARFSAPLRRSSRARFGVAFGLAVLLGYGALSAGRPDATAATAGTPILPLAEAAFATVVATDSALTQPVTIHFSVPMDATSVASSLAVQPETPVDLAWAADGTNLTISPSDRWAAGVLHTITVEAGALAASGQPLARPARAIFFTRGETTGTAVATEMLGQRAALTTGFVVTFARPVDAASVETAIRLDPPTPGVVRSSSPTDAQARFTFQPLRPLLPNVDYRLIVAGARDADGAPLQSISLAVRTTTVPTVVRFRPRDDASGVGRSSVLSVRFTQAMDRRSTARAFSVTAAGKPVHGTIQWADRDTVLVFTPSAPLPAGKSVTMSVSTVARNTAGVHLTAVEKGVFKTARAGAPAADTTSGGSKTVSVTGGGAVGGGSWAGVETYYLGLMNCTRTGGWVTSSGTCSSPGGRNVAPLKLDAGISSKVSRPYAKRLAIGADCSHFIGGSPGDRLRRAGYDNYTWAENIGCRSGSARAAVLATHLFYQSEKSYGGGHYTNLMSTKYDRVGIGVWVSGGRVRLVIDFYHP